MMSPRAARSAWRVTLTVLLASLVSVLAACTMAGPAGPSKSGALSPAPVRSAARDRAAGPRLALPAPTALVPFGGQGPASAGGWYPAGRLVGGMPAGYETNIVPPGA